MKSGENLKIDFGNWVPVKMIVIPAVLGLLCLGAGIWIHWLFFIGTAFFGVIAGYFAAARHVFSVGGTNLKDRIQDLVVDHIEWDGKGKVLDIGCGNAPLTIKVAQHYPQAEIIGLDYWGKGWDYSEQMCRQNAQLSGVNGRVSFRQGSATALPFDDASFDVVLSNLTFHEVKDAADKRDSIREALRVLKPGGVFVLQDLFLLRPYYGTPQELVETVRSWGMSKVEFIRTCDEPFIPRFVKLPFMVGTLALLRGVKNLPA